MKNVGHFTPSAQKAKSWDGIYLTSWNDISWGVFEAVFFEDVRKMKGEQKCALFVHVFHNKQFWTT